MDRLPLSVAGPQKGLDHSGDFVDQCRRPTVKLIFNDLIRKLMLRRPPLKFIINYGLTVSFRCLQILHFQRKLN
jgi:hypothetical protein